LPKICCKYIDKRKETDKICGRRNKMEKINLGDIQETLLMPLWGRAVETQKSNPKLIDREAVSIINKINYNFSKFENMNKLTSASWIARSIYFDSKIKQFTENFPDGTIVNIGCGLDTTFERIDNGKIKWYDLDLPDTIELRKKFIMETDRRKFIAESVFDEKWYNIIKNDEHIMLMIAGVLYYFTETEIRELFNKIIKNLKNTEIIFDYSSELGVKVANKKVIKEGGMKNTAILKWGTNNIYEIEEWDKSIKIIENYAMFKQYKKNYTFFKRIGMNISDKFKIMSLADIKIKN
jgi:O-methyltransferase involved in polyketide biosynthesis